ncbi:MAG: hypothetical protein ABR981_02635 [Candidatus Micrarchaeaceae archaeon]|jgi:hypothetical protein
MINAQITTIVSTMFIFLVAALLSVLLTRFYLKNKKNVSYLLWSAGLRFFAIAVLLEIMFAFGIKSDFLIKIYLLTITLPILAISLGHIQFIKSEKLKKYYYYFCILAALFLIAALCVTNVSALLSNYIVYGKLSGLVYISSSIITLGASAVLFMVALLYYKQDKKVLAIIPGIIVFWIVNIIHITISNIFIYYLDLLAIILIWLGIIGFTKIKEYKTKR